MSEQTAPADNGWAMLQLYTLLNYIWIAGSLGIVLGAFGIGWLTIPVAMAITYPLMRRSLKAQQELDKRPTVSVE